MNDINPPGSSDSYATAVSADGSVIVGQADLGGGARAIRWSGGGATNLGLLPNGTYSIATGVSADGSVVVGEADTTGGDRAFRWTQGGGMIALGTLGGNHSIANGVSADGSVVVGQSEITGGLAARAFRWSGGVMTDLGTMGGTASVANAVSANGAVVVGEGQIAGDAAWRAFRWSGGSMASLGTLGGTNSYAYGVSANGTVVVGEAQITGDAATRAFRWTQAGGMQSVEDWLRASGVAVPADITLDARGTSSDGSVVVGQLASGEAFIARSSSGLVTVNDLQDSLAGTASGGSMALSAAGLALHSAHGRPLSRRVPIGKKVFWLAGDWGRDDHGQRDGDLGLAEVGAGQNFGAVQINVAVGRTWAQQNQTLGGRTRSDGAYVLAQALVPISGSLWATFSGFGHWGEADFKRGYRNAGVLDYSKGTSDVDTWGARARVDWDHAFALAATELTPYVDLAYSEAKLAGYSESGGGFAARYDGRKDKATELRLGLNASKPIDGGWNLLGTLEAVHRFEKQGGRTSGEVIGLFSFDFAGPDFKQDWLRGGVGVEGMLATGRASLMLNATTQGEAPIRVGGTLAESVLTHTRGGRL